MNIDIKNNTRQRDPRNTASDFAKWVFDKHNPYKKTDSEHENNEEEKRKKRGTLSHERINLFFDLSSTKKHLENAERSQWDLDYRDDSPETPVLECSSLKIGDKPMRCKPDVVLKHKKTGSILIIICPNSIFSSSPAESISSKRFLSIDLINPTSFRPAPLNAISMPRNANAEIAKSFTVTDLPEATTRSTGSFCCNIIHIALT